jgi:glucosamine--fructose-6-phosphate aminotransferase (isomerizing)
MDTLHAVRLARVAGCKVLAVVNVVGSSIAREADGVFYLNCGPEIGVASTKAFTAMIAGLYFLSLRIGQIRSSIDRQELRRRTRDLLGLGVRLNGILASDPYIRAIANKYRDARNFIFLGRGTGWPLAMEGALKLKEVSYIHAEGYDAAEMKHGPIALVDENMPVLFIALSGRRYDKVIGNIQEVRARKGKIIAIASHDDQTIQGLADDVIYIRADSGIMNSICCAVPLQLLAYHIAVARGCDVDKPKNLAKSVTVE